MITQKGAIYQMVEKMSKQRTMGDDLSVGRVLGFEELLPKIQELEPTWILIEETLPTDADNVLVVSDYVGVQLAYYQLYSWWEANTHKRLEGVTLWMPLPQPPK